MSYFKRRFLKLILIVFLLATINFILFRALPGDPASLIIDPRFSPQAKEEIKHLMGLDKPLYVQYIKYLVNAFTFRFGYSFVSMQPVWEEIYKRLPVTLLLLGSSFIFASFLGIWLGIKISCFSGLAEKTLVYFIVMLMAIPSFFVQMLLLYFFAYKLPIFPVGGIMSVPPPHIWYEKIIDIFYHLFLPVFSLVLLGFGGWVLYVRELVLNLEEELFLKVAYLKGLPTGYIQRNYILRNILPPILTIFVMSIPGILGGAVITETIFSLEGVGKLLLDSVLKQDFPVAQGAFFMLGVLTVFCNFIIDLLYRLVDPRIKLGEE